MENFQTFYISTARSFTGVNLHSSVDFTWISIELCWVTPGKDLAQWVNISCSNFFLFAVHAVIVPTVRPSFYLEKYIHKKFLKNNLTSIFNLPICQRGSGLESCAELPQCNATDFCAELLKEGNIHVSIHHFCFQRQLLPIEMAGGKNQSFFMKNVDIFNIISILQVLKLVKLLFINSCPPPPPQLF